jgi:hypothetical protein
MVRPSTNGYDGIHCHEDDEPIEEVRADGREAESGRVRFEIQVRRDKKWSL